MKNNPIQFFSSLLFFLSPLFFFTEILVMAQNTTLIPVNVGVVLNLETAFGKMGLSCIQMALSDFYDSNPHYKTRLVLHTRDSKEDVVGAAAAALDLIKNVEVQAIIGPESSMQADFIINIGNKSQVPIISFSATSTLLSPNRSPYFIRATQNDSSQVKAISAIIKAFGWRQVIPIYVDNGFGEGVLPFLTDALQEIDTRIPYRSVISPSATDDQIVQELSNLRAMQTRVFIVHMQPSLGSKLLLKAKELGMMSDGYVWIITDGMGNSLNAMHPSITDSMQGILGVKTYIPNTKKLEDFSIRWKTKFPQDNSTIVNGELNIFALRAYDATLAIAMAVEKVGTTKFGFQKMNSSSNSTDLETFGVSQIGPKLRQALSNTIIEGLAGDFRVVDGQLLPSAFQIFNVIGNGGRVIGFWTPENGLSREPNFRIKKAYNTSNTNLGSVIWPGDPKYVPSWVKMLRIGVPVKNGFTEFVNVTHDHTSNTTTVTGYCIDVFNAVMLELPYVVPYEFIPFENPDGKSNGTYDDLIHKVYLQEYDAVVGDVTIIADRSSYVDFTLPYTQSGVSMVVPIKDTKGKNAWVFLKPLTWDLWLTSSCFFVFIGCVIWLLEHRVNEDFRGPPSHQLGTIFWFSFSTMVFANRERVVSNLARFVVIIWFFVVLILTQSYTASLTSMLTVQKLQLTFTNVNQLIKRGEYVGYLEGSFVFGLLKGMGFDETKLKQYISAEDCDEAFEKGSANGGIAAAFDEIPYMRLFLAKYGSKYTMVGQTYKTDGFGFVFPRGSPLVPDVSRAVLKVTESSKMVDIETYWLGQQTSCSDPSTPVAPNSLGLESFWGLFLIAGVASSLALIIFVAMYLYEHRQVLMQSETPEVSLWRKVIMLLKRFDQIDLTSPTFRKSELRYGSVIGGTNSNETSQHTNYPQSPSSISEQGGPSMLYDDPGPNGQTLQEIVSSIELTDTNEERSKTPEMTNVNN